MISLEAKIRLPESNIFSLKIFGVLIVDDQDFMRKALRRLLEVQPSFNVCGEACDGVEAVEKAMELKPQVVVMDIHMPKLDGLEATRRILRKQSDIEILFSRNMNYTGLPGSGKRWCSRLRFQIGSGPSTGAGVRSVCATSSLFSQRLNS